MIREARCRAAGIRSVECYLAQRKRKDRGRRRLDHRAFGGQLLVKPDFPNAQQVFTPVCSSKLYIGQRGSAKKPNYKLGPAFVTTAAVSCGGHSAARIRSEPVSVVGITWRFSSHGPYWDGMADMFMSPIAPDPTAGYYETINCQYRFQAFSCQSLVSKMKVSVVLFSVVAGLAVASPAANAKMVERSLTMGTILTWIATLVSCKCLSLIDEDSDNGRHIDVDGDSRK
ncbi:hypothetical protein IWW34DRAFT_837239 [Fusarium oxysporum f. sp. albedinis]|nr:hypothetical protein IWW34DRAFT_837239 [Fusarium oxysporum f. sp. albedinis]